MERIIVFDGNSILNRAFYGVRPLNTKDGFPTNALFGFVNILRKNLSSGFTHAAIAFDLPKKTFRHIKCDTYKATRKGMPEDLAKQLPYSKEIAYAMGIKVVTCESYEADDILGTISQIATDNNAECILVTGDRDSYQLINDNVTVWLAATNETKITTPKTIMDMYGLTPKQLIDLKSIMGDSSDNIKGVSGIGEKGALDLCRKYGNLDGVYDHIDEIRGATKTKLENGKTDAYMSRFLAEIVKNVPINNDLSFYTLSPRDDEKLLSLFTFLEFNNLISSMELDKPKATTNEIKKIAAAQIDEKCLLSLADKLYMDVIDTTITVFDGYSLYACPLNGESAKIFSSEKTLCFWSAKDTIRLLLDKGYSFNAKYEDISLMAYIVSPIENGLTFDKVALAYFGTSELGNICVALKALEQKLTSLLEEINCIDLYRSIELPLAKLLASIENRGFCLDSAGLSEYSKELENQMAQAEQAIFAQSGHPFNINSPKQLGVVLFEELSLPHFQKNQSGYSTSAEVLEKLSLCHPIADLVLFYRKMAKLKSTYCDGLTNAMSSDGRVHTTFKQTLTKTGRLSSTEPNLQNIPVRTEEGKKLRKFFVAKQGYTLIDADYSQIELRVLAHISGDKNMCSAFINGKDIHLSTAAKVFGVPESQVTSQMRKQAKAVNFGIVYGISDYSLSQDIGLTKKMAAEYIKNYLDTYPNVRDYLEKVKLQAKDDGFVTTMFGRRRYIPELRATKKAMISFGERVAMNTPIQGTAADIIKIAMVNTAKALENAKLDAQIILQVHDELIIEANKECADKAAEILKEQMENAAHLLVPLTVDIGYGVTWYKAKED